MMVPKSPEAERISPKVLVVEDNHKVADLLVRALGEEGYAVSHETNGESALVRAAAVSPDLIILDRMLPGLEGLEVCRRLRAEGFDQPILMLTARTEIPERIAGLDAGADDYLPKPFALGELLARARALVRRGAGLAHWNCGPLRFDFQEMKVVLDGERLDLTRRELMLLAYLARNSPRAIPRAELLEKVWDLTFDPGTNLVEVNMRRLREKLGEQSSLIETVRGVGYRLVVTT